MTADNNWFFDVLFVLKCKANWPAGIPYLSRDMNVKSVFAVLKAAIAQKRCVTSVVFFPVINYKPVQFFRIVIIFASRESELAAQMAAPSFSFDEPASAPDGAPSMYKENQWDHAGSDNEERMDSFLVVDDMDEEDDHKAAAAVKRESALADPNSVDAEAAKYAKKRKADEEATAIKLQKLKEYFSWLAENAVFTSDAGNLPQALQQQQRAAQGLVQDIPRVLKQLQDICEEPIADLREGDAKCAVFREALKGFATVDFAKKCLLSIFIFKMVTALLTMGGATTQQEAFAMVSEKLGGNSMLTCYSVESSFRFYLRVLKKYPKVLPLLVFFC